MGEAMENRDPQKDLAFLLYFDTPAMSGAVFRSFLATINDEEHETFFVKIDKDGVWHFRNPEVLLKKIISRMVYEIYGKAVEDFLPWGPALFVFHFHNRSVGFYSSVPYDFLPHPKTRDTKGEEAEEQLEDIEALGQEID